MNGIKPKCVCDLCKKGTQGRDICYAGGIDKCLINEHYTKFCLKNDTEIAAMQTELASRDAEIERLREAQRWIPVSEKLPNTERQVQVYIPELYMSVQTGFYTQYYGEDDGNWYEHWVATGNVTHWRELPDPPANGGGKE